MNTNLDNNIPFLPSRLLQAISSSGGGRVVLVLGSGCSNEKPTALPLSGDLSEECHRKLVEDGILKQDEVCNVRDLSAVAEAVFCNTGSQRDLVERFPPNSFRHVEPNEGYLTMAALFLEGVVADTLTLNFDFAARTALGQLGVKERVSTIRGPEDHTQLGTRNLIYLHGDIDSDHDDLILRPAALEDAWRERWGQVIAQKSLAGPVTVFIGLGTPASVLVETTKRIHTAIGGQSNVFVVDPIAHQDSYFANSLNVPPEDYVRMGWCAFMRTLSRRIVVEHKATIEQDCYELIGENNYEKEDLSDLCRRLTDIGLLRLGRLRAAWMLEKGSYLPHDPGIPLRLFAALVLGVRLVEKLSDRLANFVGDGLVEFCKDHHVSRVMVCSGRGSMNYARMEAELSDRRDRLFHQGKSFAVALVGGLDSEVEIATPSDIIAETDPHDLVTGPAHLRIVSIARLRADPTLINEVIR